MILLTGCGGGNSDSPSTHSARLSYPSPSLVFVAGTAITPVVPTTSQGLSSFTVTPALPAGLSLNPANGTLSGTPIAAAAAVAYTITGSGGGVSASASVSIIVNPEPPNSLSYSAPSFSFTTNIAARAGGGPGPIVPAVGGGAPTSFSISPALPAGLTFDTTTGTISGTPTTISGPTSYVVTAQNAGGQTTVTLRIEVDSGPLLDVGHNSPISTLRMSGSTVLSVDQSGHWNLWDYTSASEIASGDLYCAPNCNQPTVPSHLADMAGGTVVLATQNGFEFLSATTGQTVSSISASVSWWDLASDGSYLAAGSSAGLFVWLPSGNSLISISGDYSRANAFAAPGQIQLAASPAGQNMIQTVSVSSGAISTGPAFTGSFISWFLDGSRFFTTAGTTVLVYSNTGVQQAAMEFSATWPFVGQGNWIWTSASGGKLQVYPIVSSPSPTPSLTITGSNPIASGTTVAIATGTQVDVVDLSGTTLSQISYNNNFGLSAYAATSTSQWVFSDGNGVLLDGASLGSTLRYFDYGAVSSLAGSSGSIAVATASGRIVYFDANTLTREGVLSVSASKLSLSSDGSVLAALEGDGSIGIYSLPSAALLYTWSYRAPSAVFEGGIWLSGSGGVLTQVLSPTPGGPLTLEASPATGGSPTFSTTVTEYSPDFSPEILVSAAGTSLATTSGVPNPEGNPGTSLWDNGSLTTAVTGYPIGWIDDGHLLVNTYSYPFPGAPIARYAGCAVYSPSGQITGPCSLPEVSAFQTVASDTIYAVNLAEVLSISTSNVVWISGDPVSLSDSNPLGANAGNRVVFLSGTKVLAQGY